VSGWLFLPPYCGTRKLVYQTAINLGERGHRVILVMATSEFDRNKFKSSQGNVDFELVPVKKTAYALYFVIGIVLRKMVDFVWAPLSNILRSWILKLFWMNNLYIRIAPFHPHVIIAEDMYVAPAVSRIAEISKLPFVYRIHHIYSLIYKHHPFKEILRKWEMSVLKKADLLLTLTYGDKETANKMFGVSPQVTQFGIDLPDSFGATETLEPKANKFVLYISSYLGKEMYWLIEAANSFPDTTFIFVGRGSNASVRLPKNIRRLGIVSEQELAALYRDCKFVFIPSEWSPGQGFPIKLAEAVRSNKPILINKKASWLLPRTPSGIHTFTRVSDLRQKIDFLLNDQQNITRDFHLFDWSIASWQIEQALKEMLSSKLGENIC